MWREIRSDLRQQGGGTWLGAVAAFLWNPAFQLLFFYRLRRWAHTRRWRVLGGLFRWLQYAVAASDISPQAILGTALHLPHPTGIVIGAGAVVEDQVWIFQQVTIGSHGRAGDEKGYPVIGRGARLYAGCKILGGIRVGEEAVVGANAVVLADVPAGKTAVGIPARVLEA